MEWIKDRVNILKVFISFVLVLLLFRLFFLQIVKGKFYLEKSVSIVYRQLAISAPRGDIVDIYGRKIATSREGYVVKYDASNKNSDKTLNRTLLRLVRILKKHDEKFKDNLPITIYPFKFDVSQKFTISDFFKISGLKGAGNPLVNFKYKNHGKKLIVEYKKDKKDKKEKVKIYEYTASKIIKKYRKIYAVDSNIRYDEAREIVGLRYEIDQYKQYLKSYEPITLANDVKTQTMSEIEEKHRTLPGVLIEVAPIREYPKDSISDVHITGYVGKITAEQYKEVKSNNATKNRYKMDDMYGVSGIENYAEAFLKGYDGSRLVEADVMGRKKREIGSTALKKGDTVVLTVDNNLQKAAAWALKRNIDIVRSGGHSGHDAVLPTAGAVVMFDIHTGEILCFASYPYYNANDFINGISSKKYNGLLKDKSKPLLDRAIQSAYPPGSTFKMVTAIAGMQEKKLGVNEKIYDQGIYRKTGSECWIYREQGGSHGLIDVRDALKVSCNYFFYTVGDRLGINKLDKYISMLGLGKRTGVEIGTGEAVINGKLQKVYVESPGVLASPQNYKAIYNAPWTLGQTVTAAIGQSINAYTPIQMANYIATMANGGTRYQPHLIKKIITSDGRIVYESKPKVLNKINWSPEVQKAVLEGMGKVTENSVGAEPGGTASAAFAGFPIKVGGKTGSATYNDQKGLAHAWFLGFAPYDKPQVAIAAFIEDGAHGGNAAYLARDVLEAYFKSKGVINDKIDYSKGFKK